jgi:O-antigen/teichoic acid export membrane protein
MLLKAVIVLIVFVTILHFYRPLKVNLKWDKTVFLKLLKVGLPIFALAYLESFALTFDKILLIKYTSLKELGYYSFALYALLFSTLFSNALASYIYPKMTFKYGQDKNKLILWQYVKKITILLLLVQLPMFIAGYYIIPPAINRFFPNYIPSIVPMQILLFAGIMKGSVVGVNVIWSIKKWNFMILYQVSSAVFLFVFIFLFVNLYANKITGVAVGMLVANVTSLITGIFLAYKATHSN